PSLQGITISRDLELCGGAQRGFRRGIYRQRRRSCAFPEPGEQLLRRAAAISAGQGESLCDRAAYAGTARFGGWQWWFRQGSEEPGREPQSGSQNEYASTALARGGGAENRNHSPRYLIL